MCISFLFYRKPMNQLWCNLSHPTGGHQAHPQYQLETNHQTCYKSVSRLKFNKEHWFWLVVNLKCHLLKTIDDFCWIIQSVMSAELLLLIHNVKLNIIYFINLFEYFIFWVWEKEKIVEYMKWMKEFFSAKNVLLIQCRSRRYIFFLAMSSISTENSCMYTMCTFCVYSCHCFICT